MAKERNMQIDYDPQVDVMYIELRPGEVDYTREMTSHFCVDVDKNGTPLGIEILAVKRFLAQKEPVSVTLDLEKRANVLT